MATEPWERAWEESRERLEEAREAGKGGDGTLRVLRVHQLDAGFFDGEIGRLLEQQLLAGAEWFGGGAVQRWRQEAGLAVGALLFYLSVWQRGSTIGQRLQNLLFRDESSHASLLAAGKLRSDSAVPLRNWQKALYGLLTVALPYLLHRLQARAAEQGWADELPGALRRRLWEGMRVLEAALRVAAAASMLAFLIDGRYPSLPERLLGMRLVYAARSQPRFLHFEYLNQQLVWHGFTEFLMFLAPLLSSARLFSAVKRFLSFSSSSSSSSSPSSSSSSSSFFSSSSSSGAPGHGPSSSPSHAFSTSALTSQDLSLPCPLCGASPIVVPFSADCRHVFCYYCVRAASLDDPLDCPSCATPIVSLQRAILASPH